VTDALDRLAEPGDDLLRRVDTLLSAAGIAPGSPAEPMLLRVGALPSEVLDYGMRLDVGALRASVAELRAVGDRFRPLPARLAADVGQSTWEGRGAEAFGVAWTALAGFIGGEADADTIVGRVDATAAYLEGVASWAAGFRHELAEAIARVISSTEAVLVVTASGPGASVTAGEAEAVAAAGRIAERVLRTAADALDAADELRRKWEDQLGELEYQPPQVPRGPAVISGVTRVSL
jgi:hypothetical protein